MTDKAYRTLAALRKIMPHRPQTWLARTYPA